MTQKSPSRARRKLTQNDSKFDTFPERVSFRDIFESFPLDSAKSLLSNRKCHLWVRDMCPNGVSQRLGLLENAPHTNLAQHVKSTAIGPNADVGGGTWIQTPCLGFLVAKESHREIYVKRKQKGGFVKGGFGECASFRFLVPGNIRQIHPFGNHPSANPRKWGARSCFRMSFPEFSHRVVPSLFSFIGSSICQRKGSDLPKGPWIGKPG